VIDAAFDDGLKQLLKLPLARLPADTARRREEGQRLESKSIATECGWFLSGAPSALKSPVNICSFVATAHQRATPADAERAGSTIGEPKTTLRPPSAVYQLQATFTGDLANAATLWMGSITVPITVQPRQVPQIVSAGIAESP
jgi:hypothetical protein